MTLLKKFSFKIISRHNLVLAHSLIAVVVFLSVIPLGETEVMEGGRDKFFHALAYGSIYFMLAFRAKNWREILIFALYACCIGVFVEIVQYLLPYRTGSVQDALANVTGIAIAALVLPLKVYHKKR